MKPILEVENISKKFRIQHEQRPYLSLRDSISSAFSSNKNASSEDFWAPKDITFDVCQGESLGIIGRNGAGKSTLLKILSKITPPTSGKIISRGRIASLLEVGTGFHPELTGTENIFLNGSIMGMKRKEIQHKLDEIVEFSGVEKFLGTPLKHYSSGMQLRLAFSVAVFLHPEILVIDEVLAVGDAAFQQKCVAKMLDIGKSGATILFVSHNLSAVQSLCANSIVLENGQNTFKGTTENAILFYNSEKKLSGSKIDLSNVQRKKYPNDLIFKMLFFEEDLIGFGKNIRIKLKLKRNSNKPEPTIFSDLDIGIAIIDKYSNTLIHVSNRFLNSFTDHNSDDTLYCFDIENNLRPGTYLLTLFLRCNDTIQDWLTEVAQFNISDGNPYGYSSTNYIQGAVFPNFKFYNELSH